VGEYVVEFCQDQHGSRFVQQKLMDLDQAEILRLLEQMQPQMLQLMTDVFGNYVIQKVLERGQRLPSEEVCRRVAQELLGHVGTLSLGMYGCRVVQKALEVLPLAVQTELVAELAVDGTVMRCVRDQNGNHVIQKCVECIHPSTTIDFIIEVVRADPAGLSEHAYGCRIVQRVLEHCDIAAAKSSITDDLLAAVIRLSENQFGNYVIQHLLDYGSEEIRQAVIQELEGQVVLLSSHKFASNVVEKCLQHATPQQRHDMVALALGDGPEVLQQMMKDQYGNYVVQKMLDECEDSQWHILMDRIQAHLTQLKKFTYGKHILARVEKLLNSGKNRQRAAAADAAIDNSLPQLASNSTITQEAETSQEALTGVTELHAIERLQINADDQSRAGN
jgi:pumilio RNA-binding family